MTEKKRPPRTHRRVDPTGTEFVVLLWMEEGDFHPKRYVFRSKRAALRFARVNNPFDWSMRERSLQPPTPDLSIPF